MSPGATSTLRVSEPHFQVLDSHNLITWKSVTQISSSLNKSSLQLQDELSGEEGWANPLDFWDLGLKSWVALTAPSGLAVI